MSTMDDNLKNVSPLRPTVTESTRYLGQTVFGTVEKVYAVCTVVNNQVADPKKIEKIYSYIQDMFGPEALDYEHSVGAKEPAAMLSAIKTEDPLW